jgi:hypothetical protein
MNLMYVSVYHIHVVVMFMMSLLLLDHTDNQVFQVNALKYICTACVRTKVTNEFCKAVSVANSDTKFRLDEVAMFGEYHKYNQSSCRTDTY